MNLGVPFEDYPQFQHLLLVILGEDNIWEVRSAVADLAGKWKDLGISLRVHPCDLDTIEKTSTNTPSDCLREMLLLWLRKRYDVSVITIPLLSRFCLLVLSTILQKSRTNFH